MAYASPFSSANVPPRRRKTPLTGAFFAPTSLSDVALLQTIAVLSVELLSTHYFPSSPLPFHRHRARLLLRSLAALSSALLDSPSLASPLTPSALLCLRELYIVLHRAAILLDYCVHSSRLWLLLQTPNISAHFHDLAQEISTILDVLPGKDLNLPPDACELIELLRRQFRRSRLDADPEDELVRLAIFSFVDEFENGRVPDSDKLRVVFFDRIGIRDTKTCMEETEFLEEKIVNQEDDADPCVLGGVIALVRYCRLLLFGIEELSEESRESCVFDGNRSRNWRNRSGKLGSGGASFAIPKDFCCPISLDLMRDPVIVSTGQTYERASIKEWVDKGHCTCPNSRQMLSHNRLVPNKALRSFISQWCADNGIPYGHLGSMDACEEGFASPSSSKAAVEANRATAKLLVWHLSEGPEAAKTIAARELRYLAKTGKENRANIAEIGAIPHLCRLLRSSNATAQESSVTAILNLSILEGNKSRIMQEEGSLSSIVNVLRQGWTTEAMENAAATLFSLSVVHSYKKMIADESGAVEALADLLRFGSPRGKKDAVTALFNISTHGACHERMVEAGAVLALMLALEMEGVCEDAAGALALLSRRPNIAEIVSKEDSALVALVSLMRRGSARGKENAIAALHEMCRSGGSALTQKVARMPALGIRIQALLLTGTKRARRKAASLARMCESCQLGAAAASSGDLWASDYAVGRSDSMQAFTVSTGDVSVSVSMAISVPVL